VQRPLSVNGGWRSGLDLDPDQLAPDEELISVVDECRRSEPQEGAVGRAEVAYQQPILRHVQYRMPPRHEAVGGEGDFSGLAPEEVVSIFERNRTASHAAFE